MEIITFDEDKLSVIIDKFWERKVKEVTSNVLKKIKPSFDEQVETLVKAEYMVMEIQKLVKREAKVELAGSLAKGTNCKKF